MSSARQLFAQSPSKLNVFLEVLGRRADGFHELETVMLRTSLCDSMKFQLTDSDEIRLRLAGADNLTDHQAFPLNQSNLIVKAANALKQATGCQQGADITIAKRIPMQAGMGGGSGNAATTLLALNQLWQLGLPSSELHHIAATLGSDVNFLLSGCRAAVCTGRGEKIEPIPIRGRFSFVVLFPHTGNSTAEVFKNLVIPENPRNSSEIISCIRGGNSAQIAICLFNRLTGPAMKVNPEIKELMSISEHLLQSPLIMSGSGSTCFVPVSHPRTAAILAGKLGQVAGIPTKFLQV